LACPIIVRIAKNIYSFSGIRRKVYTAILEKLRSKQGITLLVLTLNDKVTDTQAGIFFDIAVLNHLDW
jgi:hypothetical protein